MITRDLAWTEPLEAAAALCADERCWAFLYSGQQLAHTGGHSYLALCAKEIVCGDTFRLLAGKLSAGNAPLENAWFGYFGYEMLHDGEFLPREARSAITLPDLWFARFGLVLCFDHAARVVRCRRAPDVLPPAWPPQKKDAPALPAAITLASPMPREKYLGMVADTKEAIRRGDFYQANITRKFTGEFERAIDPLTLFTRLHASSPAAYSAALRLGDAAILSSSPERFLHIDAAGLMQSRPIKGTAPRFADSAQDAQSRQRLATSEKDRAENLMIVDLMRNDLARGAIPGSVKAEKLFDISSYATVHHMESTVTGQKLPGVPTLQAVANCFPPGSMTGAPKIRAMQWCLEQEAIRRGVYSGALGWFGGDGSCDLSVVIRTLVVDGRRFEFQVGGAITADSEPEKEWQETIMKARGVMAALGRDVKELEGI